ncbi:MAG: hypothetical protein AAGN82_02705 [Myxococcota bacterium]
MLRNSNLKKLVAAWAICLAGPMAVQACGGGGSAPDDGSGAGAGGPGATVGTGPGVGSGGDDQQGICLLNNCNSDVECAGCGDGRNTCLVDENRCVACDPNTGQGCADGESCSSFGLCVPEGLTCPTDGDGTPTLTCTKNSDCAACSPMHQVCDTSTGQCQACIATNTQHCLSTEICDDGECAAKCPSECDVDADCSQCGGPGNEARACNNRVCAECSDTWPCAAGLECVGGSCVPMCGLPGPESGECLGDEDCKFCGDPNDPNDSWDCKKPINANGPNDRGICGPVATGCSDLGQNVAVLPAPWNQVTNLCSNDTNCQGVGITYNVGQALRDLVGDDKINLGFTEVSIGNANVNYDMAKCANIDLTENISCGVCVPCEVDSDCNPIQVDPLLTQIFAGEPLAQIASALLVDLLWGQNTDHSLHFQCQPVAAGYGVCAPCANPLQSCGGGNQGPTNTQGSCNHDVCSTGDALGANCGTCEAAVCQADPYCCNNEWDQLCVNQVPAECGPNTCGGGGGSGGGNPQNCSNFDVCSSGPVPPSDQCTSCTAAVCLADPYCCNNQWDSICVGKVNAECGAGTCP